MSVQRDWEFLHCLDSLRIAWVDVRPAGVLCAFVVPRRSCSMRLSAKSGFRWTGFFVRLLFRGVRWSGFFVRLLFRGGGGLSLEGLWHGVRMSKVGGL